MGAWACNIVGDRRELNAFFEIGHVAKIFGEDKERFCEVAGRLLFGTPRASRQATLKESRNINGKTRKAIYIGREDVYLCKSVIPDKHIPVL